MGRLILYDSVVGEKINALIKEKKEHCGLIIGQCTDLKDIATRLCPTTKVDDILLTANAEEGGKLYKYRLSQLTHMNPVVAKTVMSALPGGLDVLGVYVAASSNYTTNNLNIFERILFLIFRVLGKNRSLNLASTERILLTICPTTSKVVCKTYDIADYKIPANPADWRLQSGTMKWQRVRCRLAVDIKFPIKIEDTLQKDREIGLHPFFENVKAAHALVNGVHRDLDELLDPSLDGEKSKKKGGNDKEVKTSPMEWNDIELFIPLENNNISNPEVCDCICMMTLKGAVECRAYTHSKATVREAINALKQDIVRSVTARCEILCNAWLFSEEEKEDPFVVHELPRRVFAPLPQTDLCVCDYQISQTQDDDFLGHSHTAVDSLYRFKRYFELDLTEEDIDTSCEVSPTTSTSILPEVVEEMVSEFGDLSPFI